MCSKFFLMSLLGWKASQCENGPSNSSQWDPMAQNSLLRSSIKSLTIYIHRSPNLQDVSYLLQGLLNLSIDFKKQPFKLEEQGWGEFDMNVVINFADNGGTKEITHDLHFQAPKYDVTHPVVHLVCQKCINDRNSQNLLPDY